MMPLWVRELADEFWAEVGGPGDLPRRLRDALDASPLDVSVKEITPLTIHWVENHLAHMGAPWRSGEPDRPLRACTVSRAGAGYIFIDSADEQAEKDFSLAHELAHYLRHSWQPRRRAGTSLGSGVLAVIDGRRDARPAERLHATLRGVSLECPPHLLRRDEAGVPWLERRAEQEADLLAWELLAPADGVLARLGCATDADTVTKLLTSDFGLPPRAAEEYAKWLFPCEQERPLLVSLGAILARKQEPEA